MRNTPSTLPSTLHDLQVLRFSEWAALAGVSLRTGRRLVASGRGPAIVRLSSKRMGVTVGAHRQWLASRERSGGAQVPPLECRPRVAGRADQGQAAAEAPIAACEVTP
jgi:hypothetical protein